MKIYWFKLLALCIQITWSAIVTVMPENTAVEVGSESVNFTCTVQLETMEATNEHGIIWWKDYNERIVDNDAVLVNPNKYSVYGVSSVASTHLYTQILQIHDIDEGDNGTYSCNLVFSSQPNIIQATATASLLIYLGIPQPTCNQTNIFQTGGNILIISCSYPSRYSHITLQWINNEGNPVNTVGPVESMGIITLEYLVIIESDTNNQWFTCRATIPGSTETKECVIGNKDLTSVPTTSVNNIPMTSTYKITGQSSMPTSKLMSVEIETTVNFSNITFSSTGESSNEKTFSIIIAVVLGGFLLVIVIIVLIIVRKQKTTKNEDVDLNSCQNGQWLEATNSSNDEVTGASVNTNRIEDNQLYEIQLGGMNQQSEYMNSAFETDTDDFDPCYTAVNQTNVEEHERNEAKDDHLESTDRLGYLDKAVGRINTGQEDYMTEHKYQKTILTQDVDSEFMSTADMEFKRKPQITAKKPNKSTKPEDKVTNYPAPNGDLYAQVEKPSKSIPDRNTSPNGDLYAQVDKTATRHAHGKNTTQRHEEKLREKSEDERHKRENEVNENNDGEDDIVSMTSLNSTGSIHYSVDDDTLYTRVLKQ